VNNYADRAAVFRVHADEGAVFRGSLQARKMLAIVKHEYAGVGHEKLEAGYAFTHQRVSSPVVDHCLYRSRCSERHNHRQPCLKPYPSTCQRLSQGLAFVLNSEVDSVVVPPKAAARVRFEIVGAGGAAERHVQMRVHINAARENIFT